MLILSRMSLDGRIDSSNDNVFESVESEQGIFTPKYRKEKTLSLAVQIVLLSNGK